MAISPSQNQKFETFVDKLAQDPEDEAKSNSLIKHRRERSLLPHYIPSSPLPVPKSKQGPMTNKSESFDEPILNPLPSDLPPKEGETTSLKNDEKNGPSDEREEEISVVSPFHLEDPVISDQSSKPEKKKKPKQKESRNSRDSSSEDLKTEKKKKSKNSQEDLDLEAQAKGQTNEQEAGEEKKKERRKLPKKVNTEKRSSFVEDDEERPPSPKSSSSKKHGKASSLARQSFNMQSFSVCDIPSSVTPYSSSPQGSSNSFVDLGSFPGLFDIAMQTVISPSLPPSLWNLQQTIKNSSEPKLRSILIGETFFLRSLT